MKHRRPSAIIYLIDQYNFLLGLYLILRVLFGSRWWWLGLFHTFAFWLFVPLIVTTTLAFVLRKPRTAAISLILLIIGFLRFAPLHTGLLTASDESHDLRVLTFNTWILNQDIEGSIDWVLAQDADVLIFQELVDSHLSQLPRLLERYPYQEYVEGSVQILSRYPMIENDVVGIEDATPNWDGRLAVRTVVDVNGRAVSVYGVHLSLPKREKPHFNLTTGIDTLDFILHYDETHRNSQILNLAERIEAETNPVILAGDFNTSHSSPILGNLEAIGLTDAYRAVGTDWGMTWSHNPPALPLIRIDYVWSSAQLRPLRIKRGNFIGSDHLPLVVDFTFK